LAAIKIEDNGSVSAMNCEQMDLPALCNYRIEQTEGNPVEFTGRLMASGTKRRSPKYYHIKDKMEIYLTVEGKYIVVFWSNNPYLRGQVAAFDGLNNLGVVAELISFMAKTLKEVLGYGIGQYFMLFYSQIFREAIDIKLKLLNAGVLSTTRMDRQIA